MIHIIMNLRKRWQRFSLYNRDIAMVIVSTVLIIAIGTVAYRLFEGWSWLDAVYATVVTITTVGYGDLTPSTPAGRIFAIFFTMGAIGIAGYAISTIATYVIERQSTVIDKRMRRRRMARLQDMTQHTILCGANQLSKRIAREFRFLNTPFVIVEQDEVALRNALIYLQPHYFNRLIKSVSNFEDSLQSLQSGMDTEFDGKSLEELSEKAGVPYILEDPTDDTSLIKAGIDRAKAIVTALPDDRDNLAVVVGARALAQRRNNESIRIMARVEEERYIRKLYLAGADNVRLPAVIGGFQMASHLAYPEVGDWWYEVVGNQGSLRFIHMLAKEYPTWHGKTPVEVQTLSGALIIGIKRQNDYLSPPPVDITVDAEDVLIVLNPISGEE